MSVPLKEPLIEFNIGKSYSKEEVEASKPKRNYTSKSEGLKLPFGISLKPEVAPPKKTFEKPDGQKVQERVKAKVKAKDKEADFLKMMREWGHSSSSSSSGAQNLQEQLAF